MTAATRRALENIRDILHAAGWDTPRPAGPPESPLVPVREAFGALLQNDDLTFLRQTLGEGRAVEDAGRALGLTPDQARARFDDALRRLCAFAEVAQAQGFVAEPPGA